MRGLIWIVNPRIHGKSLTLWCRRVNFVAVCGTMGFNKCEKRIRLRDRNFVKFSWLVASRSICITLKWKLRSLWCLLSTYRLRMQIHFEASVDATKANLSKHVILLSVSLETGHCDCHIEAKFRWWIWVSIVHLNFSFNICPRSLNFNFANSQPSTLLSCPSKISTSCCWIPENWISLTFWSSVADKLD